MSTAPERPALGRHQHACAYEIEALADDFIAFINEFEAAISGGQVSPAFADRLAQLRQTAERLIDA